MSQQADVDTSRTRVQTYVPAFQKDEWERHADELDMSLSEFVRSMVQAGRKGFTDDGGTESKESRPDPNAEPYPGGRPLEDRVVEVLSDGQYHDWNELVTELTGGIEDRLEETLQDLQDEGRVTHSGRNGGYTLR